MGEIDWDQIEAQGGVSRIQAQAYLSSVGLAFKNPRTHRWETAGAYLTGNLRAKLVEAQVAAGTDPSFQANVEALRRLQPPELKPGEISAPLGAGWIPEAYVEQFAKNLGLGVNVEYVPELAKWTIYPTEKFKKSRRRSEANTKRYGTRYVEAVDLLEQALNGKEPTVTRRGKTDIDETYEAREVQCYPPPTLRWLSSRSLARSKSKHLLTSASKGRDLPAPM
jgi:N12 class adenine-specific DNA methylase